MSQTRACVMGTLIGAGLMYLLDPVAGRRRRARLTQQLDRLGRETAHGLAIVNELFERTKRKSGAKGTAPRLEPAGPPAHLAPEVQAAARREGAWPRSTIAAHRS